MWENIVEPHRPRDNMAHAHCMLGNYGYTHTHTHTHSEYVITFSFPQQQWLHENRLNVTLYVRILPVLLSG